MDFGQYIDSDRQKLVNDLNTISSNLENYFQFVEYKGNSERFSLKINGLAGISGSIHKNKINIGFSVLGKLKTSYEKADAEKAIKEQLLPNLTTQVSHTSIGEYNNISITITFDRLTNEVVKDIMFLTQLSEAKLRPSQIGRF